MRARLVTSASAIVSGFIVACGGAPAPVAAPASTGATTAASAMPVASASASASAAPAKDELVIDDVVVGTGAEVKTGDAVTVNYTGKLLDGTVFDSSYPRGQPFSFIVGGGQVIRGWDKGLVGMRVGGKRNLTIPGYLAYGRAGSPPRIPADATLIFDIELVHVVK